MSFYKCDPKKAHSCSKTACYLNGGKCAMTSNERYAVDPNKPIKNSGLCGTERLKQERRAR